MGVVNRLSRRFNARAEAYRAKSLATAWPETPPLAHTPAPQELVAAFHASPSGRAVYEALEPDERYRLHQFVSAPWLRRNRTKHATTVVRKCGEGTEAIRSLLDFNSTIWGISQVGQ